MSHKYEVNAKFYGFSPSKATVREYRSYLGSRYFGSKADAVDYVNHLVDKLAASSRRYEFEDGTESHIVSYFDADMGSDLMLADLHEFAYDGENMRYCTGQLVPVRFAIKRIY